MTPKKLFSTLCHCKIRHFLRQQSRILLLCLGLLSTSYADEGFSQVEIQPIKLGEGSYMFVGAGGNIGVLAGKDGILIIDDQFAPLVDKIAAALAKIQPGNPKFIINTHYHGDHTGGNAHFGKQGVIMAHSGVLKRLSNDSNTPASALPVLTYDQGIEVHFNGDTLRIMHLGPGHTDGDSVVIWQKANIVHMGDLFFKDRFPYIDLGAGGSVLGYRDNVTTLLTQIDDKTQVIPGHGDLANKTDLLRFKQMLDECIAWMQAQINAGYSLEKMQATGVPSQWQDWHWQFISQEQWIETLYQGLR
jgi:cyclase